MVFWVLGVFERSMYMNQASQFGISRKCKFTSFSLWISMISMKYVPQIKGSPLWGFQDFHDFNIPNSNFQKMQVWFILLMNFNDFNEICTQNQRVPPFIIFEDFMFSKDPFGFGWVVWKVPAQQSRWSILSHICEDWTPLPFGVHFWICLGRFGSARSVL